MTSEETPSTLQTLFPQLSAEERAAHIRRLTKSDHFLERIVYAVNKVPGGSGIDATFSVGGQIVTGTIASALDYFAAMQEQMSGGPAEGESGALENMFADLRQPYEDDTTEQLPVSFVHMRNARYVFPGTRIPSVQHKGMWWRGKIESIDGFTLLRMTSGDEEKVA